MVDECKENFGDHKKLLHLRNYIVSQVKNIHIEHGAISLLFSCFSSNL